MKNFTIGTTLCYPKDYNCKYIAEISALTALTWVADSCPDVELGCGVKAKDILYGEEDNEWMNKLAIAVSTSFDNYILVYKHDFKYWIISIPFSENIDR